ncbi:MAG: hypothetical protein GY754_20670 [bacterium]|nr:hypothetical protein [bacterium]
MKAKKGLLIITAVFFMCTMAAALWAQEEGAVEDTREKPSTIFNDEEYTFSGYGAPVVRFSKIGEQYAWLAGGRGGLIINENLVLGAGCYGIAYPTKRREIVAGGYTGDKPNMYMGYGGALIEYYFFPKSLFHLQAGVLVGGGGIVFAEDNANDDSLKHTADGFFVVEPEVNLFVNVTRFARIGVGGSYRYVNGVDSDGLSNSDIRGFSASVMFAFGWF